MIATLARRQIERLVNRALDRNGAARARLADPGDLDIVLRTTGLQMRLTLGIRAGAWTALACADWLGVPQPRAGH